MNRTWLLSRRIHATFPSRFNDAVSSGSWGQMGLGEDICAHTDECICGLDGTLESHFQIMLGGAAGKGPLGCRRQIGYSQVVKR